MTPTSCRRDSDEHRLRQEAGRRRSMAGMSCSRAARGTGCATTRRSARRCARICRRSCPAADIINDGARTVRVPVRMLEHYRFRLLSDRRCAGSRPGQGQTGRRARASQSEQRPGPEGRRRQGSRRHRAHARIQGRRHHRLAVGGPASCPICSRAPARPRKPEWKREGWDRRGARSRLDRRRSLKESVKRRALDADLAGVHRRGPAVSAAHAAPPAGAARGGVLPARCVRAACPTATASSPRHFSSGSPPVCGASTRRSTSCSWRTPPRPGNSASRTSSRSPAAAARSPPWGSPRCARSCSSASIPASCNVYLFYASDGDNASDDRAAAEHRARGDRASRALRRLCGDLDRRAQLAERDQRLFRCGRRRRDCRAAASPSPARTMSRRRCAISSAPRRRRTLPRRQAGGAP